MSKISKVFNIGKCMKSLLEKRKFDAAFQMLKSKHYDKLSPYRLLEYRKDMMSLTNTSNNVFKGAIKLKRNGKVLFPNLGTKETFGHIIQLDENPATKSSLFRLIPNDKLYLRNLLGIKMMNIGMAEHVATHVTNFNISPSAGIQGCHTKSFFDKLFQLANPISDRRYINITDDVNSFVESGKNFSRILLSKNADDTLKILFRREGEPIIAINNLKMTSIPESPELALCSYTCNGKDLVKTVCPDSMLQNIISRLKLDFPFKYLQKVNNNTQAPVQGEGFFRVMSNHQPNYFFVCDATVKEHMV